MVPPMLAIYLWPLVVVLLFRRYSVPVALCWSIIAGYMVLPERGSLNLPLLPPITKETMPSYAAVCMVLVLMSAVPRGARLSASALTRFRGLPGWLPRDPIGLGLLAAIAVSLVLTVLTNGDPQVYPTRTLPALRTYDIFSSLLTVAVSLLPLLLARKFLATPAAHRVLLLTLCIAGAIYSLPTLYEVRMSPQLNVKIYGFFASDWRQTLRDGGFRPLVFLRHGLWLGIFLSSTILATVVMIRLAAPRRRGTFVGLALWLLATLLLCKALGAFMITMALAPVILFLPVRMQLIVAAVIAGTVLFYPTLRGAGLIPVDRVVEFARGIEDERARSLQFRLNNEDILLDKANQRPAFGWGGWGRGRVYDENGRDLSVTDGLWIIIVGERGWFGYLAYFGLLAFPILRLALGRRKHPVGLETSALCVILAGNMIDLIPNAGLTSVTWLVVGALIGRLEVETADLEDQPETALPARPRYARPRSPNGSRAGPVPAAAQRSAYGRGSPAGDRPKPSET